ncbi:MAG: YitT family protein [Lachnospiraceae bacterium]|nr:YitT family protein [Lachnospiraceae bacterium]
MKEKIKSLLTILMGTVIITIGIHFFMAPNHFVCGSITGLAVVLVNFIPVSLSTMTLILNIICIVLAFTFIDKEFGVKIIFISILLPAVMFVFETLFPVVTSPTGELALDGILMVLIICYGQAILFNANAASGGLDILAKIVSKYLHVDLGQALIIAGMITVVSSVFAYDISTVVIGGLLTYFSGLALDYFIEGFTGKIRVCIISEYNEDFRKYVIETLQRGITVYTAVGGYSGDQKSEICTILTKKEYGQLMDHVQQVDPNAFVTIADVKRVVGSWNTPKRRSYF